MKKISSDSSALRDLRAQIDRADRDILRALSRRFKAVTALGELKRKLKLSVIQETRRAEVLLDRRRTGESFGISGKFIFSMFNLIQREAIRLQKKRSVKK